MKILVKGLLVGFLIIILAAVFAYASYLLKLKGSGTTYYGDSIGFRGQIVLVDRPSNSRAPLDCDVYGFSVYGWPIGYAERGKLGGMPYCDGEKFAISVVGFLINVVFYVIVLSGAYFMFILIRHKKSRNNNIK